ncbi:hypothetical protein B1759_15695 [Rubrivirga sp. SAORIC476]|uniref:hypothetical protein n=1 Tax=Rubrivirga sp. SAORIC476 TaxID=1961794 RepID=UPI000BA92A66|nr:hypothetical protein [Rubrivirga sp. SAORIC476]PAP78884.1 hypothetical protein B1759_15695 [Rubrivirga sp. SAORIC476]
MYDDEDRASDAACRALLDHALEGERAWMDELAPGDVPSPAIAPLVDRGAAEFKERPFRVRWLSFLGDILWDVFSDNNDVVGPSGERYDLGSFRGSGGFIADHLNDRLADEGDGHGPRWSRSPFGYLDFYMGTLGLFGDGELDERGSPFYVRVFERLRERGCDWRYAPPAIGLVRFDQPGEEADDPARYDPNAALAAQAERDEEEERLGEFARQLAEANAKAFERAAREPPLVVRAYREVYGEWPVYVRH